MQIDKQNLQRPTLIIPFLDEELDCNNEYVEYIETSSNTSNIVHNNSNATSNTNNTKNNQLEKYYRSIDNPLILACSAFPKKETILYLFIHPNKSLELMKKTGA